MLERVSEDLEVVVDTDWVELDTTLELDVDASELDVDASELDVDVSELDVADVETEDNWELEEAEDAEETEEVLELDTVVELEVRTVELDWDDDVEILELEELLVAEVDAFDEVVEDPDGGATA